MKLRLRPNRSASEPAVSTVAARVNVYASMTHWTPDSPACGSFAMFGIAVLMTAMSSMSIAVTMQATARVRRCAVCANGISSP